MCKCRTRHFPCGASATLFYQKRAQLWSGCCGVAEKQHPANHLFTCICQLQEGYSLRVTSAFLRVWFRLRKQHHRPYRNRYWITRCHSFAVDMNGFSFQPSLQFRARCHTNSRLLLKLTDVVQRPEPLHACHHSTFSPSMNSRKASEGFTL